MYIYIYSSCYVVSCCWVLVDFTHILQGCFTGTGAIAPVPVKHPEVYGFPILVRQHFKLILVQVSTRDLCITCHVFLPCDGQCNPMASDYAPRSCSINHRISHQYIDAMYFNHYYSFLTHWGLFKMVNNLQVTVLNIFLWMKMSHFTIFFIGAGHCQILQPIFFVGPDRSFPEYWIRIRYADALVPVDYVPGHQ